MGARLPVRLAILFVVVVIGPLWITSFIEFIQCIGDESGKCLGECLTIRQSICEFRKLFNLLFSKILLQTPQVFH